MDEFPHISIKGGRGVPRLTKDKTALASLLWRHVDRVQSEYAIRRTLWTVAWYYLNGFRRFSTYDPTQGRVSAYYLDEEGNAEFQSTEILYRINRVIGRLLGMDVRPKVGKHGGGLSAIRNRAVAQVFADAMADHESIRVAHEQFATLFTTLGCAGLCGHLTDHPTVGLSGDIEVVHPRELMPFPLSSMDITKGTSLMRVRYVPFDFLKERFGAQAMAAKEEDIETWEVDPGDAWGEMSEEVGRPGVSGYNGAASWGGVGSRGDGGKDSWIRVVKFRELWLRDEVGLVGRYVASSGDAILQDRDFRGGEVFCPIGVGRFMQNLSWYGAGMFDVLFSSGRQFELMSRQLYSNITNIDQFGVVVLPGGQMPDNLVLKQVGSGLKAMTWMPDPVGEGFNPFVIQPFNSGDVPGRVAQFAKESMDDVDPVKSLIEEKGRVDSAPGLASLDESINQAMSSSTWGFQSAWGTMYRSLTQRAIMESMKEDRPIRVSSLSLDLLGAVIDPETDMLTFADNPVPEVGRLNFTVREVTPRSETARKMEAVQLWRDGIETDPVAFRLFAMEEGLDFAMWLGDDKGALEASIRILVQLYGDGQTPGEVVVTSRTVKPELLVRLIRSVLVGPHMRVAGKAVVDDFQLLHDQCIEWMGMVLPAAVPNPDDAAMFAQGGAPMGAEGVFQSSAGAGQSQGPGMGGQMPPGDSNGEGPDSDGGPPDPRMAGPPVGAGGGGVPG